WNDISKLAIKSFFNLKDAITSLAAAALSNCKFGFAITSNLSLIDIDVLNLLEQSQFDFLCSIPNSKLIAQANAHPAPIEGTFHKMVGAYISSLTLQIQIENLILSNSNIIKNIKNINTLLG